MDRLGLGVDLGGSAPDHDGARGAGGLPERGDVFDEGLGQVHLGRRLLDVRAVEILDPRALEDRRHRANRLELGTDGGERLLREHSRLDRGFVGVRSESTR